MPLLAEPDLIVNADGSVYHICMRPQDLADIEALKEVEMLREENEKK